jgi:peptidyl-prolyl cis-trans isomerase B (cyclophilin B)
MCSAVIFMRRQIYGLACPILYSLIVFILPVHAVRVQKDADPTVLISTTKGPVVIKVCQTEAPITSKQFLKFVDRKFYDGLKFHRYEPGFVIQGGDPSGTGARGAKDAHGNDDTIPLEKSPTLHHDTAGVVGLARAYEPNSGSCQFYITLAPETFLDQPPGYAVFGRVIGGMENVMKLRAGDKMLEVRRMGGGKANDYLKGRVEKRVPLNDQSPGVGHQ